MAAAVDMFVAECGIESAKSIPNGAVLLDVKEVTGSLAHLTLGFLDKQGLGNADVGGVFLDGYSRNVAGNEGVGSLNGRNHVLNFLLLFSNTNIILKY